MIIVVRKDIVPGRYGNVNFIKEMKYLQGNAYKTIDMPSESFGKCHIRDNNNIFGWVLTKPMYIIPVTLV